MYDYLLLGLAFSIPLITVFFVQPSVAQVALVKNFYAASEKYFPNMPLLTLGGISMFIGINLSLLLCSSNESIDQLYPIIIALTILLFSGVMTDWDLIHNYLRFIAKLAAAIILVLRMDLGQGSFSHELQPWLNEGIQTLFVLSFMFIFHKLVLWRKMIFLYLAFVNAFVFLLLLGPVQDTFSDHLIAASLTGSIAGILLYARYALYNKKPLPLIGHTGIYSIGILLGVLWLIGIAHWIN